MGKSQDVPPGDLRVTCTANKIQIKDFFEVVWQQTKLQAFYNDQQLNSYEVVSVNFKNAPLNRVLAELLEKRGLIWYYRRKTFVIVPKKKNNFSLTKILRSNTRSVTGIVLNEKEQPIAGVSIFTDSARSLTNTNGKFSLTNVPDGRILQVRKQGYKPMLLSSYGDSVKIQLISLVAPLQAIDITGNQRNQSTASTSRVSEKDIRTQPVNNVLSILQGTVPGLYVNQTTGLPGGGYKIRLRGRNSIESVSDPLILVDGVPFPSVSLSDNNLDLAGMGISLGTNITASPLNLLSINDISSIEILKDADATALYGGRGANGIIVINSKTPKRGQKSITASFYSGIGRATKLIRFLDNKQYTKMRLEAIENDGRAPNKTDDYDVAAWDTTKYTNWQKEMIGGTAHISEGNLDGSWGGQTFFGRASGLYRRETTVYPSNNFNYKKGSGMVQINYIT